MISILQFSVLSLFHKTVNFVKTCFVYTHSHQIPHPRSTHCQVAIEYEPLLKAVDKGMLGGAETPPNIYF